MGYLTAFDEIYYFSRIFRDADTELGLTGAKADNYYGFNDPVDPIFKAVNILRFEPKAIDSLPAIQIVIDDERAMEGFDEDPFGEHIGSTLSIYLMCLERQTLQYNGETYRIESTDAPYPNTNAAGDGGLDLIMLLRAFVFQRLTDYRTYADSYIDWDILNWTSSKYIHGVGGVEDLVALMIVVDVNFQTV